MPGESPTARHTRIVRLAAAAALACLCFAVGALLRGSETRLSAVPVDHEETTIPACAPPETGWRSLTVVTAYLSREEADAVSRIAVSGGGSVTEWTRRAGICSDGEAREPCPTEACREGTCAVRWPMPRFPGTVGVELSGPDGRIVGSGHASPPGGVPPPMPRLGAERAGREIRLAGEPGLVARVSAMRSGRVSADVPSALGPEGTARFSVPEGTEAVRVSVSRGGEDGVAQASVLLPGPFGGDCPP
jgi:hypothetical protein